MTGSSCQFLPFLPVLTLLCRGQMEDPNREGGVGLCSAGQQRSHQHCPAARRPQEDFASSSTSSPQVSVKKGVDAGLITVQRKNISASGQREEYRLMEEEEALGSLCMHSSPVSYYSSPYPSCLLGTWPGEHCPQQTNEEQTSFFRNHHDLIKHPGDSHNQPPALAGWNKLQLFNEK